MLRRNGEIVRHFKYNFNGVNLVEDQLTNCIFRGRIDGSKKVDAHLVCGFSHLTPYFLSGSLVTNAVNFEKHQQMKVRGNVKKLLNLLVPILV
jgi:hypothetical protein